MSEFTLSDCAGTVLSHLMMDYCMGVPVSPVEGGMVVVGGGGGSDTVTVTVCVRMIPLLSMADKVYVVVCAGVNDN